MIALEKALARMVARSFMMKLPARGHQNIILMHLKNKYAEGQHGLGKFSLPDNAMKMAWFRALRWLLEKGKAADLVLAQ